MPRSVCRICAWKRVRVLVLIDQDVFELTGHLLRGWRGTERAPEQEQVVVVEHVLGAFAAGVLAKMARMPSASSVHQGKLLSRTVLRPWPAFDHARVDSYQGIFAREATLLAFSRTEVWLAAWLTFLAPWLFARCGLNP